MNTQRIGMLIHYKRRSMLSVYFCSLARVIFSDTLKGDTFPKRWAWEKGFRMGYLLNSLRVIPAPYKNERLKNLFQDGLQYGWELSVVEKTQAFTPCPGLVFYKGGYVRGDDGMPVAIVHGPNSEIMREGEWLL